MKKILLTTVFSLSLLATPAWGVWYSVTPDEFDGDESDSEGNTRTVPIKTKDIGIHFVEKENYDLHKFGTTDGEDIADEVADLLRDGPKVKFWNMVFYGAPKIKKADLDIMETLIQKFAQDCRNMRVAEGTEGFQVAMDTYYQERMREINLEEDRAQEKRRARREAYEDFLESNGPGVGIMKGMGYFSGSDSDGDGSYSDSDRAESSEENYDDYV